MFEIIIIIKSLNLIFRTIMFLSTWLYYRNEHNLLFCLFGSANKFKLSFFSVITISSFILTKVISCLITPTWHRSALTGPAPPTGLGKLSAFQFTPPNLRHRTNGSSEHTLTNGFGSFTTQQRGSGENISFSYWISNSLHHFIPKLRPDCRSRNGFHPLWTCD